MCRLCIDFSLFISLSHWVSMSISWNQESNQNDESKKMIFSCTDKQISWLCQKNLTSNLLYFSLFLFLSIFSRKFVENVDSDEWLPFATLILSSHLHIHIWLTIEMTKNYLCHKFITFFIRMRSIIHIWYKHISEISYSTHSKLMHFECYPLKGFLLLITISIGPNWYSNRLCNILCILIKKFIHLWHKIFSYLPIKYKFAFCDFNC